MTRTLLTVTLALTLLFVACGGKNVSPVPAPAPTPPQPSPPNPALETCVAFDYVKAKFPDVRYYAFDGGRCLWYVGEGDPSKLPSLIKLAEAKVAGKLGGLPDFDYLSNVVWVFKPVERVFPNGSKKFAINDLVPQVSLNGIYPQEVESVCHYYPTNCIDGKAYVSGYTNLSDPYPITSYITNETPAVAHENVHILWFYLRAGKNCPAPCLGVPEYTVVEHGYCCDPFLP